MKKILLTVLALAAAVLTASAQEDDALPISVRLGIGMPGAGHEYFVEGRGSYTYGLAGIYGDYYGPVTTSGTITADISFRVSNWFAVGADLGYAHYGNTLYSGITSQPKKKRSGSALYAIPTIRFIYLDKRGVRLYSALGLGVGKYLGFDNLVYSYSITYEGGVTRTYTDDRTLKLEGQATLFGVEWGKSFFAFGEVGAGTMFTGLRGGVGYRF